VNCSKRVSAIQNILDSQRSLDILRAAFMRCSFMSVGLEDDGSGLGSSPICPLVASFNA
jgi:hypothetical protein